MPGGDRVVATVVFTDIVDSTPVARQLGDARWKELLRRHHALIRREIKRFGGREIDTAGDGFFVTFERPAAALGFAKAAIESVRALGIEIRAGAHVGEIEVGQGLARGVAVHIGARVMAEAGGGEVLVSQTLRDLVAGSSTRLEERGTRQLKGVEEPMRVFALHELNGSPMQKVLNPDEANLRRDRISAGGTHRVSRRRVASVMAAVFALTAGSVLIVRDRPGSSQPPEQSPGVQTSSVSRLDPASGEVITVVSPLAPIFEPVLAIGEGGLWIRDRLVRHMDLDTNDIIGSPPVQPSRIVNSIAVGSHLVWTCEYPNNLTALDPADEDIVGELDQEKIEWLDPVWGYCGTIVPGGRWIWVVGEDGALVRVDPTSWTAVRREEAVGSPGGITYGFGNIWVADKFGATVEVFDPQLGFITSVELGGGSPSSVVVAGDYIWVLNRGDRRIQAINPRTYEVVHSDPVGVDPLGLAAANDAVWVADQSGAVIRIDVATRRQRTYHVGTRIGSIVVDPATGFVYFTTREAVNVNPF